MRKFLLLTPLFLLQLLAFECDDDEVIPETNEFPTINVNLVPNLKTISTGDTLWLMANYPKVTYDRVSGESIKNPVWVFSLSFHQLVLNDEPYRNSAPAADLFNYIDSVGYTALYENPNIVIPEVIDKHNSIYRDVYVHDDGKNYRFKIGIVPQFPGSYFLSLPVKMIFSVNDLNHELFEPYRKSDMAPVFMDTNSGSAYSDLTSRLYFFEVK